MKPDLSKNGTRMPHSPRMESSRPLCSTPPTVILEKVGLIYGTQSIFYPSICSPPHLASSVSKAMPTSCMFSKYRTERLTPKSYV